MIIIGYQGIGKSTLSKKDDIYIDLESSNFWYDHGNNKLERDNLWYLPYCNVAEDLSKQGYIVFVSSHKEVRDRLKQSKEKVIAIVPSIKLKDEWIDKLNYRYVMSGLDKDYKALMNAKQRYINNINEIKEDIPFYIELTTMSYDLNKVIKNINNF